MSKKSRPFIVIEALDAGGSQTQTDLLVKKLKKEGLAPSQFHFPQEDSPTGQFVYEKFLLSHNKPSFSRREQALLYIQDFYSRAADFEKIATKGGQKAVIISDRFCTSTMAYQTIGLTGQSRRAMLEWLEELCWQGETRLLKPSLVIFLDTPVSVSFERLTNKNKDFFENKKKLAAIRNSYLKLAQEQDWVTINSMDEAGQQRSRSDLHKEVWSHVQKMV